MAHTTTADRAAIRLARVERIADNIGRDWPSYRASLALAREVDHVETYGAPGVRINWRAVFGTIALVAVLVVFALIVDRALTITYCQHITSGIDGGTDLAAAVSCAKVLG